jgi:L-tartrate/succinate antiporter
MAGASFKWAVSGFGNSTVWLIFGAFMFAAGYDKTQFGRRLALILVKYLGRRSLTLGYAITFADLLLAPFTPSNTARSGDHLPDYRQPAAAVRFKTKRSERA